MKKCNRMFRMLLKPALTWLIFLLVQTGFAQGFLKQAGKQIVNGNGSAILLRGMGLGGWMLQEGYMFNVSNLGQQYRIKEAIETVVGKQRSNLFYESWLANHTTRADIDSLASWGFNSVRLPMHYNLYTLAVEDEPIADQNTWLQKGFALTDSLLAWCAANKLYLILDLHAAPGGQGNDLAISDRDPSKPSLWESAANQQKTIALWKKLASRYANEPWIGGYDIINEPNWGFTNADDKRGTAEKFNEPLRKLMVDITRAIREVDTNHLVIIEGNGFGNNYSGIFPLWDSNMAVSFHKYGNFNNEKSIQSFLNIRDQHNVPVWLGESGENSNTWFTEAIALMERMQIGWAWWQQKKMGINNPLQIKRPEGYEKLLNFWSGIGDRPSENEAWTILQELLNNLRIENNLFHKDVIDAMFRQVASNKSIPFKQHVLGKKTVVNAVDFDLGRQGVAYWDKDSASYQYTPGVNTVGNKGRAYRNDGVDITTSPDGVPYVYNIEGEEWLQYSVQVPEAANFEISLLVTANTAGAIVSLYEGRSLLMKEWALQPSGEAEKWLYTMATKVYLRKGELKLRVYAKKGGFNFRHIQFSKL